MPLLARVAVDLKIEVVKKLGDECWVAMIQLVITTPLPKPVLARLREAWGKRDDFGARGRGQAEPSLLRETARAMV